MINALLVEDERITRNGLLKHIPWSELGIDIVLSAEDAESALEMSKEYHPDIVISDIRMREIDGIKMCRFLKEKLPDCQIIFISSYAQKEYFKAAIELEAIHYVEKPIDLEELTGAIRKAVERYLTICEQRSIQKNYEKSLDLIKNETFLSLLRDRSTGEDNDAILKMAGLWNDRCRGCRICIIRWADMQDNPDTLSEWYQAAVGLGKGYPGIYSYTDFLDNTTMLLYLAAENSELEENGRILTNLRELAKEQINHNVHFLAIGEQYTDIKDLVCSYQSALHTLQCLSYLGYGTSAAEKDVFCDWQKDLGQEEERSLRKAIHRKDAEGVERMIQQIFDEFIRERAILNSTVRNICLMIYNYIREAEKNNLTKRSKTQALKVEYTYILEQAATFHEIREMLLQYAQAVFGSENFGNHGGNISIKQVIVYMHKHYQEKGLNINRMAEEVFLAPTYLSSLFKQDTGMTINQYLTKLRMEYAKSFLTDPKLKLYQIADMVGYEDAAYFARIFKNQVGITPQEYKEKNIL